MPDFITCTPNVIKPDVLKPDLVNITPTLTFTNRVLPQSNHSLVENESFPCSHFVNLHKKVKAHGTHNYRGARIPLEHNNINVQNFRSYLRKFSYPNIQILQFIEFGFPLGLWSEAYLEPCVKNHSSAYSYFSHVDKFIETELSKVGITGPFNQSPWENIMLSPMMTAHKKPNSRRTVFDASFGMFSLNLVHTSAS